IESARRALLANPSMRDQLGDISGRIVEVAREGVPVVEVEDDAVDVAARQQIDSIADPRQGCIEPVPRHEHGEVIEGLRRSRFERELRDADGIAIAADAFETQLPFVELTEGR